MMFPNVGAAILGGALANPSASYHFDESVPFDEGQKQRIAGKIVESMLIRRIPGKGDTVYFLDNDEFQKLYDEARASNPDNFGGKGTAMRYNGDIYFNSWHYPAAFESKFTTVLMHELGHTLGLDHQKGDSIMNPKYSGSQRVTEKDRERIRQVLGY